MSDAKQPDLPPAPEGFVWMPCERPDADLFATLDHGGGWSTRYAGSCTHFVRQMRCLGPDEDPAAFKWVYVRWPDGDWTHWARGVASDHGLDAYVPAPFKQAECPWCRKAWQGAAPVLEVLECSCGYPNPGTVQEAATEILRWLNEGETCPICGSFAEHEAGERCDRLARALGWGR